MENWLMNELLIIQLEQERERQRNADAARHLLDPPPATGGPGLRGGIAATLVRLGMRIDGAAGQRAALARRVALGGGRQ